MHYINLKVLSLLFATSVDFSWWLGYFYNINKL